TRQWQLTLNLRNWLSESRTWLIRSVLLRRTSLGLVTNVVLKISEVAEELVLLVPLRKRISVL
ncbi:MAG: hypothetical protein ACI4S1_10675, partial [Roseburia sp.]